MAVLFVVLPLLFLGIGSRAISFIIPTLIAVSVWCARSLSLESREALWDVRPLKKYGWRIVGRFLVGALIITVATYALAPQVFMLLPRHNPRLWLAICVLYPPLSAYPAGGNLQGFFLRTVSPHSSRPESSMGCGVERGPLRLRSSRVWQHLGSDPCGCRGAAICFHVLEKPIRHVRGPRACLVGQPDLYDWTWTAVCRWHRSESAKVTKLNVNHTI